MAAKIDEKSTVPLFTALASIPLIVGGVVWLTSIDSKAERSLEKADQAKEVAVDLRSDVKELRASIQRIEIKLGTIPTNKEE